MMMVLIPTAPCLIRSAHVKPKCAWFGPVLFSIELHPSTSSRGQVSRLSHLAFLPRLFFIMRSVCELHPYPNEGPPKVRNPSHQRVSSTSTKDQRCARSRGVSEYYEVDRT